MKPKKCKFCKGKFTPKISTTEVVCSYNCAIELSKIVVTKEREKQAKNKIKELEEGLKTSEYYKKNLQEKINKLVKEIDEGCKCIAQDCKAVGTLDAGHFRAVGSGKGRSIRFHLLNIFGECRHHNSFKGSKSDYYDGLIETFGDDIFQLIHDLPTIWKELKLDNVQLKEASKNVTECMKFVKAYKSDKILPLLPGERIELRKVCNNLIGIY